MRFQVPLLAILSFGSALALVGQTPPPPQTPQTGTKFTSSIDFVRRDVTS